MRLVDPPDEEEDEEVVPLDVVPLDVVAVVPLDDPAPLDDADPPEDPPLVAVAPDEEPLAVVPLDVPAVDVPLDEPAVAVPRPPSRRMGSLTSGPHATEKPSAKNPQNGRAVSLIASR
jgi:hypothetical protein